MQNNSENMIEGQLLETVPADLPQISPKPGYKTSQGQLTALFTVASMALAFFGYSSWTPEKLDNIYQTISQVLVIIGPLLALIPVLKNYINSRGKIQSNSIWASAAVATGIPGKTGQYIQRGLGIAEATLPLVSRIEEGFHDARTSEEMQSVTGRPLPSKLTAQPLSEEPAANPIREVLSIAGHKVLGPNGEHIGDIIGNVINIFKKEKKGNLVPPAEVE